MLKIQGRDDCIFAMSQINVILRNSKLSHLSFYLKIQIVPECFFGIVQSIIFCLIADGLLQVTSCLHQSAVLGVFTCGLATQSAPRHLLSELEYLDRNQNTAACNNLTPSLLHHSPHRCLKGEIFHTCICVWCVS